MARARRGEELTINFLDGSITQGNLAGKYQAEEFLRCLENVRAKALMETLLGFEKDWEDCQYQRPILHHGVCKEHTIEMEIFFGQPEEAVSFYLISLVVA